LRQARALLVRPIPRDLGDDDFAAGFSNQLREVETDVPGALNRHAATD